MDFVENLEIGLADRKRSLIQIALEFEWKAG